VWEGILERIVGFSKEIVCGMPKKLNGESPNLALSPKEWALPEN